MWDKFRAIFTIPELRQKIFFTLLLLAVFRVGYQIPLPIVDESEINKQIQSGSGGGLYKFFQQVSVFSASDLRRLTIFGLGIMPYISASIILQLLASVWKPLEELKKEGETGRKKINEYTRYLTVVMCLVQGIIYLQSMISGSDAVGRVHEAFLVPGPDGNVLATSWYISSILIMTCGTMFVMWLGEQ